MMKVSVLCLLLLLLVVDFCLSKNAAPKVQIYSRDPGKYTEPNILICHASGFYPPELNLELLMDGTPMPKCNQTELAFEENWFYHLTKHADFTPEKGRRYSCRVTHLDMNKTYEWEPDN